MRKTKSKPKSGVRKSRTTRSRRKPIAAKPPAALNVRLAREKRSITQWLDDEFKVMSRAELIRMAEINGPYSAEADCLGEMAERAAFGEEVQTCVVAGMLVVGLKHTSTINRILALETAEAVAAAYS